MKGRKLRPPPDALPPDGEALTKRPTEMRAPGSRVQLGPDGFVQCQQPKDR